MKVDFLLTKNILNANCSKGEACSKQPQLLKEFLASLTNLYNNSSSNLDSYEIALWIHSNENLLCNKGKSFTKAFKPGDIILADLGHNTFGHEFSYEHPCVALYNEYRHIFVIPCTSHPARRNYKGQIFPEYIEGTAKDGFKTTSTLMLHEARFIDKSRIRSFLGRVSPQFYNILYNRLFTDIFESKSYTIQKLETMKNMLQQENESLKKEMEILKKEKAFLENEKCKLSQTFNK